MSSARINTARADIRERLRGAEKAGIYSPILRAKDAALYALWSQADDAFISGELTALGMEQLAELAETIAA